VQSKKPASSVATASSSTASSSSAVSRHAVRKPTDPESSASASGGSVAPAPLLHPDINPPLTTLPGTLKLPEKPASAGAGYYIKLGRAYLKFYKDGVKAVITNARLAVPIFRRLGILFPFLPDWRRETGHEKLLTLTRSEHQLLIRATRDVYRLIPFAFVLLICGEFTPLVVMSGIVTPPQTCMLPKQLEKDRQKRIKEKQEREMKFALSDKGDKEYLFNMFGMTVRTDKPVLEAAAWDVKWTCAKFGIAGRFGNQYRLLNHLRDLYIDDAMLFKAGGAATLSAQELRLAVDARGGVDIGLGPSRAKNEDELRQWLNAWMAHTVTRSQTYLSKGSVR
jgi:hypothetical protein